MDYLQISKMNKKIKISPCGSLLVYQNTYNPIEVKNLIEENNLKGLRIFIQLDIDKLDDLNFLKEFNFLKKLEIISLYEYDFGFLKHLSQVEELKIDVDGVNSFPLQELLNLKKLTISFLNNTVIGIEKCINLTELNLLNYKNRDLKRISSLTNLELLMVKISSIKNISGVENLNKLKKIEFTNCRELTNIENLKFLDKVEWLKFDTCPKLFNLSSISNMYSLQSLIVDNCMELNSIDFIRKLPDLKSLQMLGSTNIVDGDLILANHVEDLNFIYRKHYNLRPQHNDSKPNIVSILNKLNP